MQRLHFISSKRARVATELGEFGRSSPFLFHRHKISLFLVLLGLYLGNVGVILGSYSGYIGVI